jgi:dienelactone hydrolase
MDNITAEYMGQDIRERFGFAFDIAPIFQSARLPICSDASSNCTLTEEDPPVLLFSPGYAGSRLMYNVLASAIASQGFIVITIDHADEVPVIVYPDGHAAYSNPSRDPTTEDITQYLYIRAADFSFIIDQLTNASAVAELLPHRGARPFSADRIAVLGHSLGGATAVYTIVQDGRIAGAINMDGTQYGVLPASGIDQPTMFMSTARPTDGTWDAAWPLLNGPKLWVGISNITHMALSDALSLFAAAGLKDQVTELLGTIDPDQAVRILSEYTAAWMDGAIKGEVGGPLLEGDEGERFPEVSTIKKGNF